MQMDKFGISDREKKLLFIVMAVLVFVASWFMGYTKMHQKAIEIKNSNQELEARLTDLQNMVDRQEETKKQTENYKKMIANIVDQYPVDVEQEKCIYLIKGMQDIVNIDISSISFHMDEVVKAFSEEIAGSPAPNGCYTDLSVAFGASYVQFKDLLQYVLDLKDRTTIPTIRVAYDDATGYLTGDMSYRMYYLTNTGKEYEEMPETGIEIGLPFIFHTRDEYAEEFPGWRYNDDEQAEKWKEIDLISIILKRREEAVISAQGWDKE